MTRTFEIMQNMVENMDLNVRVLDYNVNTLKVCELLSIRPMRIITNDTGLEFKVISVNGKTIIVEPFGHTDDWTGNLITVNNPTFIQGEWMSANSEYLSLDRNTFEKTPLIWLVRGYTEDYKGDDSSVDFSVDPIIYFLEETERAGWLQEDHDNLAINPMYRLCQRFVKKLKDSNLFGETITYSIKDEPQFGVKVGNKGSDKYIIDDYLSGVKLKLNLNVHDNCISGNC